MSRKIYHLESVRLFTQVLPFVISTSNELYHSQRKDTRKLLTNSYLETYNLSLFELEVVKKRYDRDGKGSKFGRTLLFRQDWNAEKGIFRICYTGNRERDLFYPVSTVHCRRYRE